MKDFLNSHYGDDKLNKSSELNETMSIAPTSEDEYTRTIENGGF